MSNLAEIEALTKEFAHARAVLAGKVEDLTDILESTKRRRLPGIKSAVGTAAEAKAKLEAAIAAAPGCFQKPRTVIFHGVKVGFQKGKGGIAWDDEERVVKLIQEHFPDQVDTLLNVTVKPVKKALQQLEVGQLKKVGCTVRETGDQVVVKPVDSDVDKLVDALLKDAGDEAGQ